MKLFRLSPRLRFALVWPVLAAVGVAAPLLWFLARSPTGNAPALLVVAVGAALVIPALMLWWLNRRFRSSLREIASGAKRQAAGDFAIRVVVPEDKELATLALSLNRLTAEIEEQIRLRETEREHFREISARDMAEAVRLTEARRELVANVSHELKTPLTAIRGYAETLEDGALDQPQVARRFTRSILEQCARLEALLGDLLTLSRLESHRQGPPAKAAVDLGELARSAVEILGALARKGEVELALRTAEDLPAVTGERDELERLMLNLIENAIKYNRPGGEVSVILETEGPEVVVEVRDTGIGIPEAALDRIFERFYRVDKGRARDQGGTGLGLSIIKHVAQNHGGRVEVESRLGKGSTFRVYLPRSGTATPATAGPPHWAAPTSDL